MTALIHSVKHTTDHRQAAAGINKGRTMTMTMRATAAPAAAADVSTALLRAPAPHADKQANFSLDTAGATTTSLHRLLTHESDRGRL